MCQILLKHLGVEVSTTIFHGHVHAASSINVPLATDTVEQVHDRALSPAYQYRYT